MELDCIRNAIEFAQRKFLPRGCCWKPWLENLRCVMKESWIIDFDDDDDEFDDPYL